MKIVKAVLIAVALIVAVMVVVWEKEPTKKACYVDNTALELCVFIDQGEEFSPGYYPSIEELRKSSEK